MYSKRSYQSGAAKRKAKKQRIECEAKGKQTLEELGWVVHRPTNCEQQEEAAQESNFMLEPEGDSR